VAIKRKSIFRPQNREQLRSPVRYMTEVLSQIVEEQKGSTTCLRLFPQGTLCNSKEALLDHSFGDRGKLKMSGSRLRENGGRTRAHKRPSSRLVKKPIKYKVDYSTANLAVASRTRTAFAGVTPPPLDIRRPPGSFFKKISKEERPGPSCPVESDETGGPLGDDSNSHWTGF